MTRRAISLDGTLALPAPASPAVQPAAARRPPPGPAIALPQDISWGPSYNTYMTIYGDPASAADVGPANADVDGAFAVDVPGAAGTWTAALVAGRLRWRKAAR